jgi:hypothetical protein
VLLRVGNAAKAVNADISRLWQPDILAKKCNEIDDDGGERPGFGATLSV